MDKIEWNCDPQILGGTTLRNPHCKANNDMALHTHHEIQSILENRKALSTDLGISLNQWVFAQQTHSNHMHHVTKLDCGKGSQCFEDSIRDCDALYTKERGIAIGVFHADCVAVLLYDPTSDIIASIHSGWQGTIQEITSLTLAQLITKEGLNPKHTLAYIAPAIAFESFEVGKDVIDKLYQMSFDPSSFIKEKGNGKYLVDNKGLNKKMLLDHGILEGSIHVDPHDTRIVDDAFFSYRRDHNCGRHLSYLYRR